MENGKIRPKKNCEIEFGTLFQQTEELGTKLLPLNLHSTMSKAVFLLSNYNAVNFDITIQKRFNNKLNPSKLSNKDVCITKSKTPDGVSDQSHEVLTSHTELSEQIKTFCRGRFIDTQCFPAIKIPSNEDFRLRWHLNYAYNSAFVNWFNLQEILKHFAPDYPEMELENKDVIATIKKHMALMAPRSGKYIDGIIQYTYTEKFFNESLLLFKKAYKDLNVLKGWMLVKQRCCHNFDDDKKPKIKIRIYGKQGRERIYEKVKSWDGVYSLEIPFELKEKLYKWYATEKRKCVKELKAKLSPYFVTR
ncbi:MAG: hypothetical protein J6W54_05460 [Fibrobacter sp.]|uniref:hypothetical protein n=1 Tax=Fibrobacter sp. TaxID=35828 RepID=UPI001AFF13E7|nr:hypothetical protein [Fibrobacter sp.]MBO7060529.1 hypothetical protein [Fibrobacter sp.]